MNPLTMLLFGGRRLYTEVFTTSQNWVAPAGVDLLNTLSGEGSDGTSGSIGSATRSVVTVTYHSSGSGVPGSYVEWDNLQGYTEAASADLGSDGSASWTRYFIHVYPDGSNTLTSSTTSVTCIEGTAQPEFTGGWQESGPITESGTGRVAYNVETGGTAGTASTGFGQTFPGGAVGGAAPTTNFTNIAVTPGSSYSLVIPTGGQITITYYK